MKLSWPFTQGWRLRTGGVSFLMHFLPHGWVISTEIWGGNGPLIAKARNWVAFGKDYHD
jgi:hypothetical protein